MKDCKKSKFKAIIGLILFTIIYTSGKYYAGYGITQDNFIVILIVIVGLFLGILSINFVILYTRCLSENNKKFR